MLGGHSDAEASGCVQSRRVGVSCEVLWAAMTGNTAARGRPNCPPAGCNSGCASPHHQHPPRRNCTQVTPRPSRCGA